MRQHVLLILIDALQEDISDEAALRELLSRNLAG